MFKKLFRRKKNENVNLIMCQLLAIEQKIDLINCKCNDTELKTLISVLNEQKYQLDDYNKEIENIRTLFLNYQNKIDEELIQLN